MLQCDANVDIKKQVKFVLNFVFQLSHMLQNMWKTSETGLRKYRGTGDRQCAPGNDRFSEWRLKQIHIASVTSL